MEPSPMLRCRLMVIREIRHAGGDPPLWMLRRVGLVTVAAELDDDASEPAPGPGSRSASLRGRRRRPGPAF
jgi:hypothetical protein